MKKIKIIQWTMVAVAAILLIGLSACEGGQSGTLTGRVLDGFGNPLGGDGVVVTLEGNPVLNHPDQYGNFMIHAPTGTYTMLISFFNANAGLDYKLTETVKVVQGSRDLGSFTLLNQQNKEAWAAYKLKDFQKAKGLFELQAAQARTGQVYLPYIRYNEGEPGQNSALTQGVLSAENGLGWCYATGFHDLSSAKSHYLASLSGGYKNMDAMVGLAGIAAGDGDGQGALDYLNTVIDEPGLYDSSQLHDNIHEVDLIAVKSLAQYLLGNDKDSANTALSIVDQVDSAGNSASSELLALLNTLRPGGTHDPSADTW
jgi:hypothetical protein